MEFSETPIEFSETPIEFSETPMEFSDSLKNYLIKIFIPIPIEFW